MMRGAKAARRVALALAALGVIGGAYAAGRLQERARARHGGTSAQRPAATARTGGSQPAPVVNPAQCVGKPHPQKTACYQEVFKGQIAVGGAKRALDTLRAVAARDRDVDRDGHVYAHAIGIEAYRQNPVVTAAFAGCSEMYSSGCYHGVIQAYLTARRSAGSAEVNALCEPYKTGGQSRWMLFQCVHGMGHGLDMFYGHNLPRALEACDLLADGWDRESCYGGAFMENIMHATHPDHPATVLAATGGGHGTHDAGADSGHGAHATDSATRWRPLNPADQLYPCSVMERKYLTACYLIQTAAMLHLNAGDIGKTARGCDRAPRDMRPVCYQSLGRDISSHALYDADKAIQLCSLGSASYRAWCHVGVVKSFVDRTATTEPGFAYCRKIQRPGDKLKCHEAVGEQIAALESAEATRAARCEPAENAQAVAACRRGARVPEERALGKARS